MTQSEFLKLYDINKDLSFIKCQIAKNYQYVRRFGLDERNNLNTDTICRCRCDAKITSPFAFENHSIDGYSITMKRNEFELKINGIRFFEDNAIINPIEQNQILGFAGTFNRAIGNNVFSVELYGSDFLYNIMKCKLDNINKTSDKLIQDKEKYMSLYGLSDISPFHYVKDGIYYYDYFFMFK